MNFKKEPENHPIRHYKNHGVEVNESKSKEYERMNMNTEYRAQVK